MLTAIRATYPQAQQVADRRVELFVIRKFLGGDRCAALVAMIDAGVRPSEIVDPNGDPGFRTSETCDLFATTPLVTELDRRLAALIRVDPVHGETMQGQRYAVGQEFKLHTDYFEPAGAGYEAHCGRCGQRTWTAMIYLNCPRAGGATRFKVIDKTFAPEVGKLLLWNNVHADGSGNGATLHQGMKVRAGTKHIVTKWFRERPVVA